MVISSRTPEGEDNCCPVCGNALRLEPSRPPGDAPCPCCGVLVWFRAPAVDATPAQSRTGSRLTTGRTRQGLGTKLRRALRSMVGGA
jgi:hypothetical protein